MTTHAPPPPSKTVTPWIGYAAGATMAALALVVAYRTRQARDERIRHEAAVVNDAAELEARRRVTSQPVTKEPSRAPASESDAEANKRDLRERQEATHRAEVERARRKTPAERLEWLRYVCHDSGCSDGEPMAVLLDAAASDRERAVLRAEAKRLDAAIDQRNAEQAAREAKRAAAEAKDAPRRAREAFADSYDDALLARHMNPDGVSADGTHLIVRGWFCSRQFVHDFAEGADGSAAAEAGFQRVECYSAVSHWWRDLVQ